MASTSTACSTAPWTSVDKLLKEDGDRVLLQVHALWELQEDHIPDTGTYVWHCSRP
jgi:hypothetical protein